LAAADTELIDRASASAHGAYGRLTSASKHRPPTAIRPAAEAGTELTNGVDLPTPASPTTDTTADPDSSVVPAA
jgi:hypothetical protein